MVPNTPSCPIQKASLYTFVRSSRSRVAESAAYVARSDASWELCSADLSMCALYERQNLINKPSFRTSVGMKEHALFFLFLEGFLFEL